MNTPNNAAALLPCPFCGSNSIDPKGWASANSAGPACDDCGASAGNVSNNLADNIAAWNMRATLTQPDALTSQPSGEAVAWMRYDGRDVRVAAQLRDNWKADYTIPLCYLHPSADAPGVAVVTDEMVERAAKAYCKWFVCGSNGVNTLALRAALKAALAPKPEGEL